MTDFGWINGKYFHDLARSSSGTRSFSFSSIQWAGTSPKVILLRKRNGEHMSREIWKQIPSDPSGSKEVPCQLRMKRVTHSVNYTTLNTATLFPKNWFNGYSANRAK